LIDSSFTLRVLDERAWVGHNYSDSNSDHHVPESWTAMEASKYIIESMSYSRTTQSSTGLVAGLILMKGTSLATAECVGAVLETPRMDPIRIRRARYRLVLTLTCLCAPLCVYLLWNGSYRIGRHLVLPLEYRFQRPDITAPERFSGIIVLVGGFGRLSEAGRLARQYPHLKVVIGGAKGIPGVFAELGGGIESSRVVLEARSRNTYENALYSAELIRPQPGERWLLVTGASHMPRAIGSFRAAGFEVEPWPVYDLISEDAPLFDVGVHEWFGLFVYRLLGRTSALLPSPIN
jgi:uncharacterized SAM-binding protein YcdF (DUF218 family)